METIPQNEKNVHKPKGKKQTENEQNNQSAISYDNIKHIFRETNSFAVQLETLLCTIQLTETEVRSRYAPICRHLESLFRHIFPRCKIHMFGSTQTHLGFKGCDLDICMDIGTPISNVENEQDVWTIEKILKAIRKIMFRLHKVFEKPTCIPEAKVPIIKFHYIPMSVSCDISFKNGLGLGIYKTELIKYCLRLDGRVRPLMMLIKYWAMHFKLTGNGRMPNFALILLVIFFLQQENINIVPPISELQRSCIPEIVDGWQVNFNERRVLGISTSRRVEELLEAFFSFYAKLDLKSIALCPIDGMIHPRIVFKQIQYLPSSMNRYKEYMNSTKGAREIYVDRPHCCVQDPIELNSNAASSAKPGIVEKFVAQCDIGSKICANAKASNYVKLLPELFTL